MLNASTVNVHSVAINSVLNISGINTLQQGIFTLINAIKTVYAANVKNVEKRLDNQLSIWDNTVMKQYKEKTCNLCGSTFKPNSGRQVYCCKACSRQAIINQATNRNKRLPGQHANSMCKTHYHRKYGIAVYQYNQLFQQQYGCCAVCGRHQSVFDRRLDTEHDHATDKIRGLVCRGCNYNIGKYEHSRLKNAELIKRIQNYLAKTV